MIRRRDLMLVAMCAVCCIASPVALAADAKSAVANLLSKMPAPKAAEETRVATELVKLGPAGIGEICKLLVPPGTGDDTKARYALSGLAVHVCRSGAEPERKMYAGAVLAALASASDNEVKAFLIRQLQVAGKAESVDPLGKLLADKRLCEPATQALIAIRTPDVPALLANALRSAQGGNRVTIINALGALRCKSATAELIQHASSNNANTRRAALHALANIGAPSAAAVLSKAAQATAPYDRAQATSFYLLFARRLAGAGQKEQAAKICRDLIKTRSEPNEQHVRCAALGTLVSALGQDALGDLLEAMDVKSAQVQYAALELARDIPGPAATAGWVEKMRHVTPAARARIVEMLGRRGDPSALPPLLTALKDADKAVRLAAIPAAGRLGRGDAVRALLTALKTDQPDEVSTIKAVLMRVPGEPAMAAVAGALGSVPPPSRAALLDVLAARRATAHLAMVFAATQEPEAVVRLAAIRALLHLTDERSLPRLIELVLSAKPGAEQMEAQKAVVSAAQRTADPEKRAEQILTSIGKTKGEKRAVLLRTLPKIGGKKALEVVLADVKGGDATVKEAATGALAAWPELSAAGGLLDLVKSATEAAHRSAAIKGYVRLVGDSKLPGNKKVSMYADALAAIPQPPARQPVLVALGNVKTVASLNLVATYLDDSTLKDTTAAAVVKIVCPQKKGEKGLRGPHVVAALEKVVAVTKDVNVRKRAKQYLDSLPKPDKLNLALARAAKTSVPHQGNKVPELAVDGNVKDRNSAWFGATWPSWLQVDLGKRVRIDTVHVYFYWDGNRSYQYNLQTSTDGKTFKTVVDMSKNVQTATPDGVIHSFGPIDARHVRINVLKNSVNEAVHLVELKVYAEGTGPKPPPPPPPPKPDAEGFIPLFNGQDLTGWTGHTSAYRVEDGKLVGGGSIYAAKQYSDFVFRFEFKLTPGANSGVAIRSPMAGTAAYTGMEIQILDDTADRYKHLQPYQYHGSIYGVAPAKRGHLKSVGQWNTEEITAKGPHVTVKLNGVTIVDADIIKASTPKTMDGKHHPGLKRTTGHLGFVGHGSRVEFRNIRIKELK